MVKQMMKKLNICILSQEFPPYTNWGGIASYNYAFADSYVKMGHDVTVISRSSDGAPKYEKLKSGVEIWRIGKTILRKKFVGRTIDRLLHSKSVYAKVAELSKNVEFDIIEATEAGLESWYLLKDPKYFSKIIIQCNGSNFQSIIPKGVFTYIHKLDVAWSLKKEQKSLQCVRNILVTSDATREFLKKNNIDSNKITLIPQGINIDKFCPALNKVKKLPLHVGFVGRLEESKGIDFIWKVMDAIGPNNEIMFHFLGSIHWTAQKEIEKRFKQYKEFSIYHSPISRDEMPSFYQSLDILLLPSRFENFGLAYVEAMACELVVFAGKQGGGGEIIEEGVTGFLVDPDKDANIVVTKLFEMTNDMDIITEIGKKARKSVCEHYSLQKCSEDKIAYYNSTL